MLRKLSRKNQPNTRLDLPWRNRRLLRVRRQFCRPSVSVCREHTSSNQLYSLDASPAIRSKISFTNEFNIAIALFEIPVSGCTCFNTTFPPNLISIAPSQPKDDPLTLVDIRAVCLLASLLALLLFAISGRRRGLALTGCLFGSTWFSRCFGGRGRCWGLTGSRSRLHQLQLSHFQTRSNTYFGCHYNTLNSSQWVSIVALEYKKTDLKMKEREAMVREKESWRTQNQFGVFYSATWNSDRSRADQRRV